MAQDTQASTTQIPYSHVVETHYRALSIRSAGNGFTLGLSEWRLLAPSVTGWAHMAFPELRADRPYHQPGDDKPHAGRLRQALRELKPIYCRFPGDAFRRWAIR